MPEVSRFLGIVIGILYQDHQHPPSSTGVNNLHAASTWSARMNNVASFFHHVPEQRFISIGRPDRECFLVVELHLHRLQDQLCQRASFLLSAQRFEAGDDVEQFLVDATLAQTMECPVEVLQRFVDVFVGALHRRQAARVLARKGFGACPEERDKKISADERPQGRSATAHDFGELLGEISAFF